MVKRFCDRCQNEIGKNSLEESSFLGEVTVKFGKLGVLYVLPDFKEYRKELCSDCFSELEKFFQ